MSNAFDVTKINLEELGNVKSILKDRFSDLIEGYIDDTEKYLQDIEEAILNNDLKTIADNAHPLKSSSAYLGMSSISEIAKIMEETAKNSSELDEIKELIDPLREAVNHGKSKLNSL